MLGRKEDRSKSWRAPAPEGVSSHRKRTSEDDLSGNKSRQKCNKATEGEEQMPLRLLQERPGVLEPLLPGKDISGNYFVGRREKKNDVGIVNLNHQTAEQAE